MAETQTEMELMRVVTLFAVFLFPVGLYIHPKKPPFLVRLAHYVITVSIIISIAAIFMETVLLRWPVAMTLYRAMLIDYSLRSVTNFTIVSLTFWNSDTITRAIVELRETIRELRVSGLKVLTLIVAVYLCQSVRSFAMLFYSYVNFDRRSEVRPRFWYFNDGFVYGTIFYGYCSYFVILVQVITSLHASLCVVISLAMKSLEGLQLDLDSGKATRSQCVRKYIHFHGRLCKVIRRLDDSNYVLRGYLMGNSLFVQTLAIRVSAMESNFATILSASSLVAGGCVVIFLNAFVTAEMNHRVTNSLKVLTKLTESKAREDTIAAKEGTRHNQLETERKELRSNVSLYIQHVTMTNPAITILKLCNFSYSTVIMMGSIMATYSIMLYGIPEEAPA